jgi:hypothetical protein
MRRRGSYETMRRMPHRRIGFGFYGFVLLEFRP